ncbi:hypothetical protein CIB48_g8856 [Xylaria polymorpha]|nr:hypothetical protein CIB48_g8856 [Xylaria polymorpha]
MPCFSFLIQHPTQNRTLVFDLGLKKNCEKWPKPLYEYITGMGVMPVVTREVREFLNGYGIDMKKIEGVIWSRSHFDHVGDVSTFEPKTKIIVGIGSKERFFPGYTTKKAASFNESDVAGHDVEEIDFGSSSLKVGGLPAVDYFTDGTFYLLDTPGHCFGHIPTSHTPCIGEIFDKLLPNGREAPFYHASEKPDSVHVDAHKMAETIKRLQEFDARDNILLVPVHDVAFLNVAEFFPNTANAFMEKGWVEKTRWAWLAEFAKAVGEDENIPRKLFGDARPPSMEIS